MYAFLFLVIGLFLFAALGFTIKFCISKLQQSCCFPRRIVGIFSCSDPRDYHWITQGLNSPMFRDFVESTFPSIILTTNKWEFREAVEKCDFAILYHTKNRGRVNLTNVTDSIYDDELKYMSMCKGRLNVIVVIDDLEKNDYEEKHRILQSQPDIQGYARDLILVSREDKMDQWSNSNKLQQIRDLMADGSGNPVQYCNYLSSMAHWFLNTITRRPRQSPGDGLDAPLLV